MNISCDACGRVMPYEHYTRWQIGAVIEDHGYMTLYYCCWSCWNQSIQPQQILGENAFQRDRKDKNENNH